MKKNVAGQGIGCQMTTIADGTNFTSAVTVYITGDSGTQTIGSVGSGICVHEGKGFHSYAPSQAETNFDHIAFTFEGTGAITKTVQVYTSFPQTGDSFVRLGVPVNASISADIAEVLSEVLLRASQESLDIVEDFLDTEVAAVLDGIDAMLQLVKIKTDALQFDVPDFLNVNVKLWKDEAVPVSDTDGYPVVTIKDGTGQGEIKLTSGVIDQVQEVIDRTDYQLSAFGVDMIHDEVVEGAVTFRQSMRLANAANAGKLSGAETSNVAIRDLGDTKDRISATVDGFGNRSVVVRDLS